MRILAAHDAEGNIHHVVISTADAPPATVTTETDPGLFTEVEIPDMLSKLDLSDLESSGRQLDKILQQLQDFRVELKAKGKLIRKGA